MKILIYATAAEMGGAITILNQYYQKARELKDDYFFILSKPKLEETNNIKIFNYECIKKSWVARIYFYWFKLPKIVKRINPDKIISFNNVMIKRVNYNQTIYLHQSLPFFDYQFNIFTETYLWIVKNIIGFWIKYSLKRADYIIVQSNWLKQRVVDRLNISSAKISVEIPSIEIDEATKVADKPIQSTKLQFIYPAGYVKYKNHQMVIDAVKILTPIERKYIEIKFTFDSNESKKTQKISNQVNESEIPINFVGNLKNEEILNLYKSHILIFASGIETFGLPLLEAMEMGTKVYALQTDFSKEILKNYKRAKFYSSEEELAIALSNEITEFLDLISVEEEL